MPENELKLGADIIRTEAIRRRDEYVRTHPVSADEWNRMLPVYEAQVRQERFGMIGLRDYLAGEALPAVYAKAWDVGWSMSNVAERAYQVADAMLKARETRDA